MPIRRIIRSADAPPLTTDAAPASLVTPPPRSRPQRADSELQDAPVADAVRSDGPPPEDDSGGYKVGRGKPPLQTRFKKGVSGNPKGRPSGSPGLNKLIRDTLLSSVPVRTEGGTKLMTKIEAIIHKQLEQAVKGNQRAAIQLMSLYAAAVPDQTDHAPEGTAPLTETDQAIIERFRTQILSGEGDDQ